MTTKNITIDSIVKNLNIDELIMLSNQFGLSTSGITVAKSTGIYRRNLKNRMIKQLGEPIYRHIFIAFYSIKLFNIHSVI